MSPARPLLLSRRAALMLAGAVPLGGLLPAGALADPAITLKATTARYQGTKGSDLTRFFFNETQPGPPVRLVRGQPATLRFANALDQPMEMVFPGIRGPLAAAPLKLAPGEERSVTFTPPDAGTFLYRSVAPGQSALGGPLIVAEPGKAAYDSDLILFIQVFAWQGRPPVFTVNDSVAPTLDGARTGRTRLRIINGTPVFLPLKLDLPDPYVIAVDGQPAEPFALMDGQLQLAPGGRADIAAPARGSIVIDGPAGPIPLATLKGAGEEAVPPPAALPSNGLPDFSLSGSAALALPLGGTAPAFLGAVKTGRPAILTITNPDDAPVAVEIAGHPVRLLDAIYDGWQPWWHDTVPVPPKATVRVGFKAQAPGRWSVVARRAGDGTVLARTAYEVTK